MTSDFTLLIHGPVSIYTILTLYRYREEFPIILVTPKPKEESAINLLSEVQRIAGDINRKINLFIYDFDVDEKYNYQNKYLHFFSVAFGLEVCKTQYMIKLRSDEFYSKLDWFADIVRRNRNKIVTNDVFFRKQKTYPIHPSDHLVGGKTQSIKKIFQLAKQYCEDENLLMDNPFTKGAMGHRINSEHKLAAEQVFGLAAVATLTTDKQFDKLDEIEIMKQLFEIVTSDKLGFFRIGTNTQKIKEYFDTSYFNEEEDIKDILDYGLEN